MTFRTKTPIILLNGDTVPSGVLVEEVPYEVARPKFFPSIQRDLKEGILLAVSFQNKVIAVAPDEVEELELLN
jgi:hypothetical protein